MSATIRPFPRAEVVSSSRSSPVLLQKMYLQPGNNNTVLGLQGPSLTHSTESAPGKLRTKGQVVEKAVPTVFLFIYMLSLLSHTFTLHFGKEQLQKPDCKICVRYLNTQEEQNNINK